MSPYLAIKNVYRAIIPQSLNRMIFDGRTRLSRVIIYLKALIERDARHDELYDAVYFERQRIEMVQSGRGIADSLVERLPGLRSVVDVGCGSGAVLSELTRRGVEGVGLEYAEAALAICRENGLNVRKFDIEAAEQPDTTADLALSTEVAEHLPERCAEAYVDLLTSIADTVVMTAATPGQGGTDHVNEQPNAYWIEKFAARGFKHDHERTEEWRVDWRSRGVDRYRAKNVMIFTRDTAD